MTHIDPPPGFDQYGGKGLLDSIAENALDDDYYEVRSGKYSRSRGLGTLASATAVMLLALMVTIAAVQTRTDRPIDELERDALISDIGVRKDNLAENRKEALGLRKEVLELQKSDTGGNPEAVALRLLTAQAAATGQGIQITVDSNGLADAPTSGRVTETDLQILVNGLWYAGAEAISINGNRLSTLSAIGRSGQSITANYRSLARPYTIVALGNKDQLEERIGSNPAGKYWVQRVQSGGLRFDVEASGDLAVPSAPEKRVDVFHAEAIEGES